MNPLEFSNSREVEGVEKSTLCPPEGTCLNPLSLFEKMKVSLSKERADSVLCHASSRRIHFTPQPVGHPGSFKKGGASPLKNSCKRNRCQANYLQLGKVKGFSFFFPLDMVALWIIPSATIISIRSKNLSIIKKEAGPRWACRCSHNNGIPLIALRRGQPLPRPGEFGLTGTCASPRIKW